MSLTVAIARQTNKIMQLILMKEKGMMIQMKITTMMSAWKEKKMRLLKVVKNKMQNTTVQRSIRKRTIVTRSAMVRPFI